MVLMSRTSSAASSQSHRGGRLPRLGSTIAAVFLFCAFLPSDVAQPHAGRSSPQHRDRTTDAVRKTLAEIGPREYTPEETEDVIQHLARFVKSHKRFVSEMQTNPYGALALGLSEGGARTTSNDGMGPWSTSDSHSEQGQGGHVEGGHHDAAQVPLSDPNLSSASTTLLETSSKTEATTDRWWRARRPKNNIKPKYDKSQTWWRCSCRAPAWTCRQNSTCVAPEVTEEDRLKDEAMRQQVARKTGQPLTKGRFEGKTYHEGALECMIEKTWKCTWNRHCACEMPWKNVPQCRPLKRIAPPICPVKCKKKAWPWNWICSRWCGCPGCSSPYCHSWFWLTLVCRTYCKCEGKCPNAVVTAAPPSFLQLMEERIEQRQSWHPPNMLPY